MKRILRSFLFALTILAAPAAAMAGQARQDRVETAQQGVSVEVTRSGIEIASNTSDTAAVTVYTIAGTAVKSVVLQPGDRVTVDLPAGYYIIKTPQRSIRVLVR